MDKANDIEKVRKSVEDAYYYAPLIMIEAIVDLSREVKMWREQYNKAADTVAELSGKRQLKVEVGSIESIALGSLQKFEVEDDN